MSLNSQKRSGLQGVIACVRRSVGFEQPSFYINLAPPTLPVFFNKINSCCRSHRGGLAL